MMDDLKDNPLAAELLAECATAYFSTAKKLAASLKALRDLDEQRTSSSACPDEKQQRRAKILAEAAEWAWFFVIQREALKLPYYDELFADFDIPDEVRQRMGPRKIS
jgi:hypothetical protein